MKSKFEDFDFLRIRQYRINNSFYFHYTASMLDYCQVKMNSPSVSLDQMHNIFTLHTLKFYPPG